MMKRCYMILSWMIVGAACFYGSATGCAAFGRYLDRNPETAKFIEAAAEKGAASGTGTAIAASGEGEWRTAAVSGASGVLLAALALWIKNRRAARKDSK